MARISAITNDGKEQSKAEGNLKSVLKMASLIAGNNHQIIINKNELDGFVTESKLEICTLLPQEIIENMSFHGTINCACELMEIFICNFIILIFLKRIIMLFLEL